MKTRIPVSKSDFARATRCAGESARISAACSRRSSSATDRIERECTASRVHTLAGVFEWSEAVTQFISFLFSFFATGAVAFRIVVLKRALEPEVFDRASRRAATIGLIGAVGTLLMYVGMDLPRLAARQHTSVMHAATANLPATIGTICIFMLVIALGLALSRVDAAWIVAAIAVVVSPLAPLLAGQWTRVINPVHRLAGGLWIGTLFVMLIAGFVAALQSSLDRIRRGQIAAAMTHSFSPLALTAFTILALSGLTTAWRHLKHLNALWTTPYGYALIAKLCVVAIVVALGAWNWKRQRPLLGTESAAAVLRRSATAEVVAATIVLVITAVLVSLPSPK